MVNVTEAEFAEWCRLTLWLKEAKKKELAFRNKIVEEFNELNVGTNKRALFGTELKVIVKETISLDEESYTNVFDELSIEEADCVKYDKPRLDKALYKALPANNKLALHCVTKKFGAPTVSIIEEL